MNSQIATEASDELLLRILDDYVEQRSSDTVSREAFMADCQCEYSGQAFIDDLPGLLHSLDALHGFACSDSASDLMLPAEAPLPTHIGQYEIVREVGRGGMGVVYEAKDTTLNRSIALKVLPKATAMDRQQVSRFLIEVQAAGGLNHPNIVPVFWAGQIDGVHCYSMPLIDGKSLDQIIFGRAVAVEQTIGWAIQAATAIDYAHEYGVIHRDIKPSNLILDRQGKLWITDFGLARLCSAGKQSLDHSGITHSGAVVGTARYMSPEQSARTTPDGRKAKAIADHRSDIYSLGVTLCEMLTGCRHEPDLTTRFRKRNPKVSRDLETVLLKAMSEDPVTRYQTAGELADDLQAVVDLRPISAKRPSTIDRFAKWTSRHKRLVVSAIVISLLSLIGSAGLAGVFAHQNASLQSALQQADENLHLADDNLKQARLNFDETRQVLDHFGLMAAERLRGVAGAESLREDLVRDLLLYYERFVSRTRSNEMLRSELVQTHLRAAKIIEEVGAITKALAAYRRAESLLVQLPPSSEVDQMTFACRNSIAMLLAEQGRYDDAESLYRQMIDQSPRDTENEILATTRGNYAALLMALDRETEAEDQIEIALAELNSRPSPISSEPDATNVRLLQATLLNNLSHSTMGHDLEKCSRLNERAIEALRATGELDAEHKQALATSLNNRASICSKLDRPQDAIGAYRDSIRLQRELLETSPMVVRFSEDLAITYNNLARLLQSQSRGAEAEASIRSAEQLMQSLVKRLPQRQEYRDALAGIQQNLRSVQP